VSGAPQRNNGFALVAVGDLERGDAWAQHLRDSGMEVALIEVDARDRAKCDQAVADAIESGGGRLDVLVSATELRFDGSIEDTPEATFRELLEANLTAAFRIGRACFSTMRERAGGAMIFVASDAGIRAAHETAAYSVMSAGLIAAAELFAAEGTALGIRANALCPSPGVDVAPAIAWLASDESTHVNGATIRVDGAAGAAMVVDTRT
jgi:NAD(P)-dependent dehydrogenase (short-subunit alcohol dehydrogenase family)